ADARSDLRTRRTAGPGAETSL
ncbi:MAG: hypothetical protein AVDCRST_MAG88-663, partial [uncultured Thermomicrobiales bacterium]